MKKLVTLFTLAIAMVASADVASQNIVGYNTVQTDGAYFMIANPFANVGGGVNTIDKLQGVFESGDQIIIMYTEEDGFTLNGVTYQYLTLANDGMDDGWYDGAWNYVGDTLSIDSNKGVYYYSSSSTIKGLTSSGEVAVDSVSSVFVDPYTTWASAFPVALNPNDSRFTWSMSSGDQMIVMYSEEDGFTLNGVTYQYLTLEGDGMDDGWYDGSWAPISEPIANIGQGVYIFAPAGGSVVETSPIALQ